MEIAHATNYGFIMYTQVRMTKLLVMLSVAVRCYEYVLVLVCSLELCCLSLWCHGGKCSPTRLADLGLFSAAAEPAMVARWELRCVGAGWGANMINGPPTERRPEPYMYLGGD